MPELKTKYMGLDLKTPLVVSANPLSQKVDNIVAMEDAGAGAVVLFSLFEEQIRREASRVERIYGSTSNAFPEAADYFPAEFAVGSEQYLEIIRQAKARTGIPIIASLNGVTPEGWIEFAHDIEQAGADGLEVNIYFIPGDISMSGADVERRYLDIVKSVRDTVDLPIAVKLNPYFSSIGHLAQSLYRAGADALVLFNRFYQPDFEIEELTILPTIDLSTTNEIRLPLLWIGVLYGRVPVSLAATTGIHGARELIKYILAGADVGMVASTVLRNGIGKIKEILLDLEHYMNDMPFQSVDAFRGTMSQERVTDPAAFERSNYIQILETKRWR